MALLGSSGSQYKMIKMTLNCITDHRFTTAGVTPVSQVVLPETGSAISKMYLLRSLSAVSAGKKRIIRESR